jgi:chromosome segregation ATPase
MANVNVLQMVRELERDYQAYVAEVQVLTAGLEQLAQELEHGEQRARRTQEALRHVSGAIRCLPELIEPLMQVHRQLDGHLAQVERQLQELGQLRAERLRQRGQTLRRIREVKAQIKALADTISGYEFVALPQDSSDEAEVEDEGALVDSNGKRARRLGSAAN